MKISVTNKAKRCIIIDGQTLVPGVTLVDEKKYKSIASYVKNHDELNVVDEEKDADNICAFNIKDAEELVTKCFDEDIISEWKKQEEEGKKRPKILKAMDDQVKLIKDSLVPKGDK